MFLVLSALLPPIILRVALLIQIQGQIALADIRGFSADIALGLLVSLACSAMLYSQRNVVRVGLSSLTLIAWSLANYGSYEHIKTLGSMPDVSNAAYLFNQTFFKGSALHVSSIPTLLLAITLPLACLYLHLLSKSNLPRKLTILGFSLAFFPIALLFPFRSEVLQWRQTHFILANISYLFKTLEPQAQESTKAVFGIYPADLDGAPRLPLNHPRTNVLLVILEGISGAMLDTIASEQDYRGERPELESLNSKIKDGLVYTNFINHQRQTNRGVYSLVCGDLPKMKTSVPKMTLAGLEKENLFCLPEALRRNGYRTIFLQAAPLSFMGKDAFAPKVGYTEHYGIEWFGSETEVSDWGVDDQVFLKKSAEYIKELKQGEKPWFLTLLSSGTHHPFNVPPSFESAYEPNSFGHAVAFLDFALSDFLHQLETSGIFDNTLVIFTSDESFGLPGSWFNDQLLLNQAWGYLAAFVPEGTKGIVSEPFLQLDVATSVLDYLGYASQTSKFRGRSIFRRYQTPRMLPFANTYLRSASAFSEQGDVFLCQEDLSECRKYARPSALKLFSPLGEDSSLAQAPPLLQTLVARSSVLAPAMTSGQTAVTRELIKTPTQVRLTSDFLNKRKEERLRDLQSRNVDIPELTATYRIFGDQYLSLSAGGKLELELEVEVSPDADVKFIHYFTGVALRDMPTAAEYLSSAETQKQRHGITGDSTGLRPMFGVKTQKFFGRTVTVPAGKTLRYRYSFGATEDYERLQLNLLVSPTSEKDAFIDIRKAFLTITQTADSSGQSGIVVANLEPTAGELIHETGYIKPSSARPR